MLKLYFSLGGKEMKENISKHVKMTGEEKLQEYLTILEKTNEEYIYVKSEYENACAKLHNVFAKSEELLQCNNKMIVLELDAAFQMGLDFCHNQSEQLCVGKFSDVDYNILLDEGEIHKNQAFITTEIKIKNILNQLPSKAENIYDSVVEYNSFLQTYIPKIANYFGVVAGCMSVANANYIAFCEDYREWLNNYLNIHI